MREGANSAGSVAIVNCGRIVTGDVDRPLADGDTILVTGGHIAAVGERLAVPDGATVVDARGQVAIPGLIDSHIHPVPGGDWTPRVSAHDWLAGYAQAGVTTATSQGSWHQGGYPDDAAGMVALSITLARAFAGFRPGGMKVHGATVSLVDGLTEADLELLRRQGVWLVAEVGSRSIVDPERVRDLLAIAHRLGYVSRVHFGPEAVPGTHTVTAAMALVMGAQIASHVNGGPSAPPFADLDRMVTESDCFLELSYPGNHRALLRVASSVRDRGQLRRLIAGSDTPTGAGVLPRAILQTVGLLAAFAELPAEVAVAVGSGTTADAYGLNTGKLLPGREADVLLIDAPKGSTRDDGLASLEHGDVPSVSLLMIDGRIVSVGTKNTLPPKRLPEIHQPREV